MESTLDRSQEGQVQALNCDAKKLYDSGPQFFSHDMKKLGQLMFSVLTWPAHLPEMTTKD